MIRIVLFLIFVAALAFGFSWLADRPGDIVLTWQGYRVETSLLVALGVVALLAISIMVLWSILRFIFRVPAIMSLTARARRHNKGFAAVSKGMVAAAIGDAKAAEKASREATKLLGSVPLVTLLQAQSAQISGDRERAIRTFNEMMENPETRVLGLRGLYLEAHRNGDSAAAHAFAKEAYSQSPMPWAGQALLEFHSMADDWSGALSVVESSIARKAIDKKTGNRQRGVLKAAIARDLSAREPDEALRIAREAIKLAPDLIPAYAIAGSLLARRGDIRRAGRIIETGWRVTPHPELARVYLDLRPGDSATDRLARARTLTRVHSSHPESRMTLARAAIEARDFSLARKTMEQLFESESRPTVRACLLMADIEETEQGSTGKVREWLGRATRAARDPMWVADGIVTDTWAPASPVTGKLDAFVWDVPVERIAAPVEPEKQDKDIQVLPPVIPAGTASAAGAQVEANAKSSTPAMNKAQVIVTGAAASTASAATADKLHSAGSPAESRPAIEPEKATEGRATGPQTGPGGTQPASAPIAAPAETASKSAVAAGAADKPDTTRPAPGKPDGSGAGSDSDHAAPASAALQSRASAEESAKEAPRRTQPEKFDNPDDKTRADSKTDSKLAKPVVLAGPPDDPGPRR